MTWSIMGRAVSSKTDSCIEFQSYILSKVKDFDGKWCTHFSRQWAHSDVEEHSDMCGRDGDPMMAHHPVMELSASWRGPRAGPRSMARAETGTWTAAGAGAGEYSAADSGEVDPTRDTRLT